MTNEEFLKLKVGDIIKGDSIGEYLIIEQRGISRFTVKRITDGKIGGACYPTGWTYIRASKDVVCI